MKIAKHISPIIFLITLVNVIYCQNVTIKESPIFIKNRLIASGIRPINNVVDISNYVMLEVGQPLHFYDLDRLGRAIKVRMAEAQDALKDCCTCGCDCHC